MSARQRERTRICTRVDELPPEARSMLDTMLADVTISYRQIETAMRDAGYEIGKSSIGRYAMRTNSAAARLNQVREMTKALIERVRDNQGMDVSEIAMTLAMDGVIQELASASPEDYAAIPLEKLIDITLKQERNAVYKSRYTQTTQQLLERLRVALMAELAEQIRQDPALVSRIEEASKVAAEKVAAQDGE